MKYEKPGRFRLTLTVLMALLAPVLLIIACNQKRLPASKISAPGPWSGQGRVFLVPLGNLPQFSLDDLPVYYWKKFSVRVTVLPRLPLKLKVEDSPGGQLDAGYLIEILKDAHPSLSSDYGTILIGITNEPMQIREFSRRNAFNLRRYDRFAIISVAQLDAPGAVKPTEREVLRERLRKLITKNIGILYHQLPLSEDPTSVLYGSIEDATDIDRMTENYIGSSEIWKPRPAQSACVSITQKPPEQPVVRFGCNSVRAGDTQAQSYLLSLELGWFASEQIDFYFDEPFPLELVRSYWPRDERSRAFGIGTNHSLDIFLVGDSKEFTYIHLILQDGRRIHYKRVSDGSGYADAIFTAVGSFGTSYSGSSIRWNGDGWNLLRSDGWTLVFPASEGVTRSQQAALTGMRHTEGRSFEILRDERGNLKKVTSPGKNFIQFSYDGKDRVVLARDNHSATVTYEYDAPGRLTKVVDSKGRIWNYSYDSKNQMLSIRDGVGKIYIENVYDEVQDLIQQELSDGSVIRYQYDRVGRELREARCVLPNGYVTRFQQSPSGFLQSLPERLVNK